MKQQENNQKKCSVCDGWKTIIDHPDQGKPETCFHCGGSGQEPTTPPQPATVEEAAAKQFPIPDDYAEIDKYVEHSKRHGFIRGYNYARQSQPQWRETAKELPEDETMCLVYFDGYGIKIDEWTGGSFTFNGPRKATHWMPLPKSPTN